MIDNKSAFEYTMKSVEALNYLSKPLFAKFNATNMAYCRLLKDGRRVYLSTSAEWIRLYSSNNFQDHEKHSYYYAPKESIDNIKHSLWSGAEEDEVFSACYFIDHYHGFSFHNYNQESEYFEYIALSTTKEDYQFPNRCLNNLDVLSKYVETLKKNAHFLFDHHDKRKLMVSRFIPQHF